MLLSEKLLNGIEAVLYIAHNSDVQHRSRGVEDALGLPTRYLEPIFQRLVKHDVLESTRGPGGGYSLAKEPSEICVGKVISALQEDGKLRAKYKPSHPLGVEVVSELRETMSAQIIQQLGTTTIADLCKQARAKHI